MISEISLPEHIAVDGVQCVLPINRDDTNRLVIADFYER